jgi:hypothetical protein
VVLQQLVPLLQLLKERRWLVLEGVDQTRRQVVDLVRESIYRLNLGSLELRQLEHTL